MEAFTGLLAVLILLAIYFLPTIIATFRGHKNALGVGLLNLFLGWTLFGWVGALIWSVLAESEHTRTNDF